VRAAINADTGEFVEQEIVTDPTYSAEANRYDVAPGGGWLLLEKDRAGGSRVPPPFVRIVTNWYEDLRELVPVGR